MNNHEIGRGAIKKEKRIFGILDSLDEGKDYSEIQKKLNIVSRIDKDAIGEQSVSNVEKSLQTLSFVEKIEKTIKNSKEDTVDKHDLIVLLSTNRNVESVGVQVKSSLRNVSKFYKKFNKDKQKAQEMLTQKKLIVINGQLSESGIRHTFIKQLSKINKYHKIKTFPSKEERTL